MLSVIGTTLSLLALVVAPLTSAIPAAKATPSSPPKHIAKPHRKVCDEVAADATRCFAHVVTDSKGNPAAATSPSGYGPAQLRGAYNLTGSSTAKQTIAIVDAYNDPYISSDLSKYSSTFNLPQMKNCAVASGTPSAPCFQKVNQRGGTSYPSTNAGWSLEISLDVEAAHALCQTCNLLLVEADSSSYTNLMTAVDRAVSMGANEVSMSWGSNEFSGESGYDAHFNHPGVAFTVSSGDNGYGAQYPASSPYVTSVGGTSLFVNSDNSYAGETVWDGAGSGCSSYENQFSSQSLLSVPCSKRVVADVSADADPSTGAAVYDSVRYQGRRGWFQVGGTSLAAPLVAATYALAGVPSGVQTNTLPYNQGSQSNLHDVTSGSTINCDDSVLCTAGVGYDGASGLGSPNGTGAF